jgi:hypothetical protein
MLPLEQVIGEIETMDYSTVSYTPSAADIQCYRRLRIASVELNRKILKTMPREALKSIASRLGLWKQDMLVLTHENEQSVLMDSCLYDWIHDGANAIEHYVKSHIPAPDSDEYELLAAYRRASYRIVKVDSQIEGAGIYCSDFYSGDELFIMDMGFSISPVRNLAICTRAIFLNPFWMTTGAALPANLQTAREISVHLMKRKLLQNHLFTDQHETALTVIRMLLEQDANANVEFHDMPMATSSLPATNRNAPLSRATHPTSGPGRNSACPCGSGKRYKRCCGE